MRAVPVSVRSFAHVILFAGSTALSVAAWAADEPTDTPEVRIIGERENRSSTGATASRST